MHSKTCDDDTHNAHCVKTNNPAVHSTLLLLESGDGGNDAFPSAMTEAAALTTAVWIPVLANLCSIAYIDRTAALATLPNIFTKAQSCEHIAIMTASIGTAERPVVLTGGIMCVSMLYLSGELHVVIPSGVTSKKLIFTDCNELGIRHVFAWLLALE